jgi:uncharacterized membrane protein HdeD (DUF308 family)
MSTASDGIRRAYQFRHELESLRGEWMWFVALGVALIVLGVIALGMAPWATMATILFYGVLLIIAGIVQTVGSFWSREWSGFFLSLLAGILYLVVGFMFVRAPGDAALAVTLLLAAFLIVSGVFRIVGALMLRLPQWGWVLASGILNVLLGLYIWSTLPISAFWVIGVFLGIELVFDGWMWVLIGLALRNIVPTGRAPSVV